MAVPGAVVAAGITVLVYGDLGAFDAGGWVTAPVFVMPEFSLAAVVGIGLPLYVVTMATQNVPGLAVMRAHGYAPEPGPLLSVVGGFSVLSAPGARRRRVWRRSRRRCARTRTATRMQGCAIGRQ